MGFGIRISSSFVESAIINMVVRLCVVFLISLLFFSTINSFLSSYIWEQAYPGDCFFISLLAWSYIRFFVKWRFCNSVSDSEVLTATKASGDISWSNSQLLITCCSFSMIGCYWRFCMGDVAGNTIRQTNPVLSSPSDFELSLSMCSFPHRVCSITSDTTLSPP